MFHCRSISHHHADLIIRERLSLTTPQQQEWLSSMQDAETIVLSTCNRLELYAYVHTPQQVDHLWADLLYRHGAGVELPYTRAYAGMDAAHHLFRVSCGLESMALGEPQILGQVTRAYEQAHHHCTAGNMLSLLFRAAIYTARRAHTETSISVGGASVSSLGISRAESALGGLTQRSVIVLGAGEMGQMVVKTLVQRRVSGITLISRTYENARQVAEEWNVSARPITELKEALLEADVLFTTSNAPFVILDSADIAPIMQARDGRPLCIVDLAVPRDVGADVGKIPGVRLFDLDDLQQTVEIGLAERQKTIPQVEQIIEDELALFWKDAQGRAVAPTIRQIREQAERLRQAELARVAHRLEDEEARQLVDQFSHRLINKMLHQLTCNLKASAAQQDGAQLAAAARSLFGLDDNA